MEVMCNEQRIGRGRFAGQSKFEVCDRKLDFPFHLGANQLYIAINCCERTIHWVSD